MKRRVMTLIELAVVIAIIAVLLGVAVPVFRDMKRRAKLAEVPNVANGFLTANIAYLTSFDFEQFCTTVPGHQAGQSCGTAYAAFPPTTAVVDDIPDPPVGPGNEAMVGPFAAYIPDGNLYCHYNQQINGGGAYLPGAANAGGSVEGVSVIELIWCNVGQIPTNYWLLGFYTGGRSCIIDNGTAPTYWTQMTDASQATCAFEGGGGAYVFSGGYSIPYSGAYETGSSSSSGSSSGSSSSSGGSSSTSSSSSSSGGSCYDSCVKGGGSAEDCDTKCGGSSSSSSSSGGTCYDSCVATGAGAEVCAEKCGGTTSAADGSCYSNCTLKGMSAEYCADACK